MEADSVLKTIIEIAMEYAGVTSVDKLCPREHDGILFFQVGRNASHEFYLGRKDGETWKRSVGESMEEDEHGIPLVDERIYKLEDEHGFGYIGH
jgi:hypothetical protein